MTRAIDKELHNLFAKAKPIEKLAVGTRNATPLDTENPPLAFATPYGTDSAYEKRLATVKHWCFGWAHHNKDNEQYNKWVPTLFDNTPQAGFSFDRVTSRYRTNSKYFRVNDPRGFQIEITAKNLLYLISCTNSIGNGIISDEVVYARIGSNNWLILPEHMTTLKTIISNEIMVKNAIPMKRYTQRHVDNIIYLGEYYQANIGPPYYSTDTYSFKIEPKKKHLFVLYYANSACYFKTISPMVKLRESRTDTTIPSSDEIYEKMSDNKRETLEKAFSKTPFTTEYKDFITDRLEKLNNIWRAVGSHGRPTQDAFSQYTYFKSGPAQGDVFSLSSWIYQSTKVNETYIEKGDQALAILDEIRKKNLEVFKQAAK